MSDGAETTKTQQRGRPFEPGQSGNPAGRPKGSRHKATLAIEALLEGEAEGLTRKAIEMALAGDNVAIRLCLDRIAPARKDRHVTFDLPPVKTAADAVAASGALMAAVSAGDLTPSEAAEVSKILDIHVKTLEAAEFEARLSKLEEARGRG